MQERTTGNDSDTESIDPNVALTLWERRDHVRRDTAIGRNIAEYDRISARAHQRAAKAERAAFGQADEEASSGDYDTEDHSPRWFEVFLSAHESAWIAGPVSPEDLAVEREAAHAEALGTTANHPRVTMNGVIMANFAPGAVDDPTVIVNPDDAVMYVELSSAYADHAARAERAATWLTDLRIADEIRAQFGTGGIGPFGTKAKFGPVSDSRDWCLVLTDIQACELIVIGDRSGGVVGITAGELHVPTVPDQTFAVDTFRQRPDRYI